MSDNNNLVNRRNALKSIGSAGLFAGFSSQLVAGSDDTITITTAKLEEKNLTREVPIEWYNRVEHTREVLETVRKRYAYKDFVGDIIRRSSDENILGFSAPKIVVEVDNLARNRSKIPNEVAGVTISTEETQTRHVDDHASGWCNADPSYFYGGSYIEVTQKGSIGKTALTALVEVTDSSGEKLMMTAAHGFADVNCANGDDKKVKIGSQEAWFNDDTSSNYIGEVKSWDWFQDWATVHIDESKGVEKMYGHVHGDHGATSNGHVTKDGVDSLIDSGETVYNYGARTCETSGKVTGYTVTYPSACGETAIECTTNAAGGDSGSPHYEYSKGTYDTYSVTYSLHHSHKTYNGSHTYSYGIAAFKIADKHSIGFY